MFSTFKKDKITKIIMKEREKILTDCNNNNINFLETHYLIEDMISKVYKNNNFYYQDILNRKRKITSFHNHLKDILISFFFGIIGSVFFSAIFTLSDLSSYFSPIVSGIFMFISIILISFFTILIICRFEKSFSNFDSYNVNSYELNIIDDILKDYEDNRKKYTHYQI